jgi:hypothetical protein
LELTDNSSGGRDNISALKNAQCPYSLQQKPWQHFRKKKRANLAGWMDKNMVQTYGRLALQA